MSRCSLINSSRRRQGSDCSFCIRKPDAVILDPACGGGTFLVRAYSRKKYLAEQAGVKLPHQKLIDQLYGIDISSYAAHLTMLNLATRDLIDERNYPLVAQSDFFDVRKREPIFHVPLGKEGSGGQTTFNLSIDEVDAVVGNPPYVRQEEISKPLTAAIKGKAKLRHRSLEQIKVEADKYKKHLRELIRSDWPGLTLSGRSDLHIYFWPHASAFVNEGGYYGFVTSSSWLDVEYGFGLQKFLLDHFAILAIFESAVEPWFTGARVATCTTILRREADPQKRAANLIRFVQLRSPLSDILPSGVSEADRQLAVETLRDRIESITENTVERHWRVRVVSQDELEKEGYRGDPDYQGSKWGIPLRAPDLFFEILDRYGDRFVPLGEIAEVRFGVKTGCDKFFFPRDITERCLEETTNDKSFKSKYGIHRYQTDRIRVVKAGDRSVHLIEAEYLEPEVHNLMEIDSVEVKAENCARCILVCSSPKEKLKGKHVLDCIKWGEREHFQTGSTCASRATSRPWYDLNPGRRGDMFWPMIQKYRHIIARNVAKLICNHNLFDLFPRKGIDTDLLHGALNSTLVGLIKNFYGRFAGTEGTLKTEVIDVDMILVPDVRSIPEQPPRRLKAASLALHSRQIGHLRKELTFPDRRELDLATLEAIGVKETTEQTRLCDALYQAIDSLHAEFRHTELQAMENRKRRKRAGKQNALQLADEIVRGLDRSLVRRFPSDFIERGWESEIISLPIGQAHLQIHELLREHGIEIDGQYLELADSRRARFAKAIADLGIYGAQAIPIDPDFCD